MTHPPIRLDIDYRNEAVRCDVGDEWTWAALFAPGSSPRVLDQTLEAARRAGLKWHLLEEFNDIDTLDDLKNFAQAMPIDGSYQKLKNSLLCLFDYPQGLDYTGRRIKQERDSWP